MKYQPWFLRNFLLLYSCLQSTATKCLLNPEIEIKRHFYVEGHEKPLNIEQSSRISHQIVSHILKILLNEVVGYPDVRLAEPSGASGDNATRTLQIISDCDNPNECNADKGYVPKVMINLEVSLPPGFNMEGWIATKRVEDCGPLGPVGRTGWYIANYTVNYFWKADGIVIDHWRAFTRPEVVAFFDIPQEDILKPLNNNFCTLEECGPDGIYKPLQCRQSDAKCATLLADYPASTFKLLKHEITSLGLLVKVAWVGEELENIVWKRTELNQYTLFFHKKPMLLSSLAEFVHVSFKNCEDFASPSCQFEINQLEKIVWSKIKDHAPHAFHVLRAINFPPNEYKKLLDRYKEGMSRGFDIQQIACRWVTENIYIWDNWIPDDIKNKTKTTLYIGGIFPVRGIYWKQGGVVPAAHMAAEFINNSSTILANYNLAILEQDGHCAADQVMKSFINYVTNATYKTMVGILGPACSDTVEPIAGVAKHFNTVIISYSAEGALFSNREKYPYFFRTIPENNQFRYVYLKLFQQLKYKRVAALTEDGQKYPEYLSYLQDMMQDYGMTFIVNRKFPRERPSLDMKPYLLDLKKKGAKIIIGDFYDYAARAVMCDAYKLGMTAANGYVWFLPPWFPSDWFDTNTHNTASSEDFDLISCTTEQMVEAINGHMSLSYKFYADLEDVMQEGKTVGKWLEDYDQKARIQSLGVSHYGGYAYDAVWVYALALDTLFKENNSHVATLHSGKTSKRLVELLNETNFTGVTGPMFFSGSSRVSDVLIWQWLNNTTHQIGVYHPTSHNEGELELNESNIVWLTHNGKKPNDDIKEYHNCAVEGLRELLGITCELAILVVNLLGLTVLVVLVISIIIIYKRRYEKRMKITEARMKELGLMANSGPFVLDEWEMPRDHIVLNRKLGEGAFGTVYGGEACLQNKGWISVAVKTLKCGAKSEEKLDFLSEAEVMKKLDHVNIVKLIGVCTMGEPVYTVMEFMLYGDLKTYLLSRRNLAAAKDRASNDEVSDKRLTRMALDIVRGLSYLADQKYVHRDLACRNCLVNISRSVKIADFGMCRAMYDSDYYRYNKKGMLPVRWMAPESINDGLFTPMSDVWSYGVVLYEIVTFASFPYQGLSNNQVLEYVKNFNTLVVPKECKPELRCLFTRCWSRSPSDRPQAAEIVEIFANNPELISPCLDVPKASVAVEDSGTLELTLRDRSRGPSLSSVWQNRKNTAPLLDQARIGLFEISQAAHNSHENGALPKQTGFKFASKKSSLHESFRKKNKKENTRDRKIDFFPESTYL